MTKNKSSLYFKVDKKYLSDYTINHILNVTRKKK